MFHFQLKIHSRSAIVAETQHQHYKSNWRSRISFIYIFLEWTIIQENNYIALRLIVMKPLDLPNRRKKKRIQSNQMKEKWEFIIRMKCKICLRWSVDTAAQHQDRYASTLTYASEHRMIWIFFSLFLSFSSSVFVNCLHAFNSPSTQNGFYRNNILYIYIWPPHWSNTIFFFISVYNESFYVIMYFVSCIYV